MQETVNHLTPEMQKKKSITPDISIVIPSYNSAGTIKVCLTSLCEQRTDLDYEILVVDSGNDNTSKLVKKYFPKVKLIKRKKRTYPGTAINIGIKRTKGEIIAILGADCIADQDWLDNMYAKHRKYDVVSGKICNGNPENIISWAIFLTALSEFIGNKEKIVANSPSGNISYKKWIFKKYGYFLDVRRDSDWIFNSKIKEKILFTNAVIIKHLNRTNFLANLNQSFHAGYCHAIGRKKANLPGAFLLRYKFLIPALLFYRFFKIGFNSMRARYSIVFLVASPLIFSYLIAWTFGFWRSAVKNF